MIPTTTTDPTITPINTICDFLFDAFDDVGLLVLDGFDGFEVGCDTNQLLLL